MLRYLYLSKHEIPPLQNNINWEYSKTQYCCILAAYISNATKDI